MTDIVMKVLVCDDSILVQKKLNDCLNRYGNVEILNASDGEDAWEKYQSGRPEVVFLDIVMPKMNGLEVLKKIKESDSSVTVIMVSSTGTQSNLRQAIELGADDFIQKPWNEEHIARILDKKADDIRERSVIADV